MDGVGGHSLRALAPGAGGKAGLDPSPEPKRDPPGAPRPSRPPSRPAPHPEPEPGAERGAEPPAPRGAGLGEGCLLGSVPRGHVPVALGKDTYRGRLGAARGHRGTRTALVPASPGSVVTTAPGLVGLVGSSVPGLGGSLRGGRWVTWEGGPASVAWEPCPAEPRTSQRAPGQVHTRASVSLAARRIPAVPTAGLGVQGTVHVIHRAQRGSSRRRPLELRRLRGAHRRDVPATGQGQRRCAGTQQSSCRELAGVGGGGWSLPLPTRDGEFPG